MIELKHNAILRVLQMITLYKSANCNSHRSTMSLCKFDVKSKKKKNHWTSFHKGLFWLMYPLLFFPQFCNYVMLTIEIYLLYFFLQQEFDIS